MYCSSLNGGFHGSPAAINGRGSSRLTHKGKSSSFRALGVFRRPSPATPAVFIPRLFDRLSPSCLSFFERPGHQCRQRVPLTAAAALSVTVWGAHRGKCWRGVWKREGSCRINESPPPSDLLLLPAAARRGMLEAGGQTDISHLSKTTAVAVFSPLCYKCMGCFLSHRWEGKIGHGGSGRRGVIKGIITEASN